MPINSFFSYVLKYQGLFLLRNGVDYDFLYYRKLEYIQCFLYIYKESIIGGRFTIDTPLREKDCSVSV